MKNLFKNNQISNKLFSLFTNTAVNSSSKCTDYIWQQAKAPKCLLEKEIKDIRTQN
jgi:hypothetical protein